MRWAGIVFSIAAIAGVALAQEPVAFSHEPVSCVSSECGRIVVTGRVESTVSLQSVQVRFNDGTGAFYYVEMIHSGDWNFYAVLPSVLPGTTSVTYKIVAITEDGTEIDGPTHTIPVTDGCAPAALTEEQTAYALNTAIGLTNGSQSGAPEGFSCAGIVKTIRPDGVMSDNSACEEVRLAESDVCLIALEGVEAAVVAEGMSTGRAAAYTAAGVAVGVGGAIIWDSTRDDKEPVSRSRP